jgi:phage-related minor tail protein
LAATQATTPLAEGVSGPVASASDLGGSGIVGAFDSIGSGISSAADSVGSAFSSAASWIGNLFAKGDVFPSVAARRYGGSLSLADYENQVIEAPTLFRFARGGAMGVMGEAGPEAVMPLRRGSDGKLGVAAGGQPSGSAPTVNFHIHTPDANSFRASQAQITSRMSAHMSRNQARSG